MVHPDFGCSQLRGWELVVRQGTLGRHGFRAARFPGVYVMARFAGTFEKPGSTVFD